MENQTTLQRLGSEAEEYYSIHRLRAGAYETAVEDVEHSKSPNYGTANATHLDKGMAIHLRQMEYKFNEHVENSARFVAENIEQLHDLAVIEAHLAGVAINIEQYITIGKKVGVREYGSDIWGVAEDEQ